MKLSLLVKRLLEQYPNTRGSDKELIIGVLQARGANLDEHQRQLLRGISFESITRARRKYQEEGLYLPSEAIQRTRKFKSMSVQQSIPSTKPDSVQELIERNPPNEQGSLL